MAKIDFKDYYKTLGVEKSAGEKVLRSAFRKLARQYHPDVNPGDDTAEERFKEINEAYEVLSDPDKRKLYDRFGEDWQRYKEAGYTGDEPAGAERSQDFGSWYSGQQPGSGYSRSEYGQETDFSAFFNTTFGSRSGGFSSQRDFTQRTPRKVRGSDLEAAVDVTFPEAYAGTTRQFDVQVEENCPTCGGTGVSGNRQCSTCGGAGLVLRSRTIEVKIPAGVDSGSKVRVAGQGGAGRNGGANGDVYLRVNVLPDQRFTRDGDNLRTDLDIPLYTAILGGEAIVTTPSGKVALNIPAETAQGKVFRLRNKGMPKLKKKGEHGDLLARANVRIPDALTEQERELFEELQRLRGGGTS